MPDSPFQFRHSGTNVKALTYGNLGTGGLSRATFEQTLPDDHPSGGFVPGFGTHLVEHRAIDPAGNVGPAGSYRATVLPGASPACTVTLTGRQTRVTASQGVTCLTNARVTGHVTVRAGASLVGPGQHDQRHAASRRAPRRCRSSAPPSTAWSWSPGPART